MSVVGQIVASSGSIVATGLSPTLVRNAIAYDLDGSEVAVDTGRFDRARLMVPAPSPTVIEDTITVKTLDGGLDLDGTPVTLTLNTTNTTLIVAKGAGALASHLAGGSPDDVYTLDYSDATKNGGNNLLKGQSNDIASYRFDPAGGMIHDGMVYMQCTVEFNTTGTTWVIQRTALLYASIADLIAGTSDPWVIAGISAAFTNSPDNSGSHWSITKWAVASDELLIEWCDYRGANGKDGGMAFESRFTKSGSVWSLDTTILLDVEYNASYTDMHYHCGGVIVHGDGDRSVLIATGDTAEFNHLLATTLTSGGQYSDSSAVSGTGIGGVGTIEGLGTGWSTPAIVYGSISVGGSGTTIGHNFNQVISMVPGASDFSSILCGNDESCAAILKLTYDPDTTLPRFETVYLPTSSSVVGEDSITFGLRAFQPGGPYLALTKIGPGADAANESTRIIYSADGANWGQLYHVSGGSEQIAPVFEGSGVCIYGRPSSGNDAVSIPIGTPRASTPVSIRGQSSANVIQAPGGSSSIANRFRPSTFDAAGLTNVEVSDANGVVLIHRFPEAITAYAGGADQPANWGEMETLYGEPIPLPPCHTEHVYEIRDDSATSGFYGDFWPTSRVRTITPAGSGGVGFRLWVYALPIDGTNNDNQVTVKLEFQLQASPTSGATNLANIESVEVETGRWVPVTFWQDIADFYAAAYTAPIRHTLRVCENLGQSSAATDVQGQRFLIAFDQFWNGATSPDGFGGYTSTAEPETLTIDLPEARDTYTAYIMGWVPEDSWDQRTNTDGGGALTYDLLTMASAGDADVLTVRADTANGKVVASTDSTSGSAGTDDTAWFGRGTPLLIAVVSDGTGITARSRVGHAPVAEVTVADVFDATKVTLGGTPILLDRVIVVDTADDASRNQEVWAAGTAAVAPIITSPTSASIEQTIATLGGDVTDDGGAAITERGVVYAQTLINADPIIGGTGVTKVTAAGTTGLFTVGVTGLTPDTAYTYKAFATNAIGTSYTSADALSTLAPVVDANITVTQAASGGTINLGSVALGSSPTQTLTINNAGEPEADALDLDLGVITVSTGTLSTDPSNTSVAAGASTTAVVTLDASAEGATSTLVTIPSNDPDTPSYTVTISATVVGAELIVSRGEDAVADGAIIDLGGAEQGAALAANLTLENTGLTNLTIGTIMVSGALSIDMGNNPSGDTLAPGETATLVVEVDTSVLGSVSGTVSVPSNDSASPLGVTVQAALTASSDPSDDYTGPDTRLEYLSVSETDAIIAELLVSTAYMRQVWGSLSNDDKLNCIANASIDFDEVRWVGSKQDADQPTAWPRVDRYGVLILPQGEVQYPASLGGGSWSFASLPREIRVGVAVQAAARAMDQLELDQSMRAVDMAAQGLTGINGAGVSWSVDGAIAREPRSRLHTSVRRLVDRYLVRSVGVV